MNSTVNLNDIVFSESEARPYHDKGDGFFHAEHKGVNLVIANGKDRKPGPWYWEIDCEDLDTWFAFVRLVNRENRKIKKMKRDKDGLSRA